MTTPQKVLEIAAREIGYKEEPPGSNRTKYGRWYGPKPRVRVKTIQNSKLSIQNCNQWGLVPTTD